LKELAGLLNSQVRSCDFLCRYAGDEFVAILQVGRDEADELTRRIQRAVDKHDFAFTGSKLNVGMSAGWACFGIDGDTIDELLLAADRAMYIDKSKRKQQFTEAQKLTTGDLSQFPVM
jgi:diguanylate cyclase (GGDEF)-like protein